MPEKGFEVDIEEFLENKNYGFKIYAKENYDKLAHKNHFLSLTVYFYPPEKEISKKSEEFHQVFKKYYSQLKIPCKGIILCKESHLHEYFLDDMLITLGTYMNKKSHYIQFVCSGAEPEISLNEINKLKDLFKKFRLLLEYNNCKSEELDFFVNKLSKNFLVKYAEGLPPSIALEAYLKTNPGEYKISKENLNDLIDEISLAEIGFREDKSISKDPKNLFDEISGAEIVFREDKSISKDPKNLFHQIEKISFITKPIFLLLSKRLILPNKYDISKYENLLDHYNSIRKEMLEKIEQDPEQKMIESYEEEYLGLLIKLKNTNDEKERKKLVKEAKEIAIKFNYDPKKDLETYLQELNKNLYKQPFS